MVQDDIDICLRRISNVLLLNAGFSSNIGLLHGKMGVAMFFFHYGRHTGNEIYTEYAGELIDEMYEEIHHAPRSLDLCYGLCGLGKYLVERLNGPSGKSGTEATGLNKEYLALVVDRLEVPYVNLSLFELLSVIQLLSEICSLNVNNPQSHTSLNRAVRQLEHTLSEIVQSGAVPGLFNSLSAAAVLVQSSESTGKREYAELGSQLLNNESDFRSFYETGAQYSALSALKYSLLYHYLGNVLHNNYRELSLTWLSKAVEEDTECLAGFRIGPSTSSSMANSSHSPECILTGYAGVGLMLLTLAGGCSSDWLRLIPILTLIS